jgi:hypothetical protein
MAGLIVGGVGIAALAVGAVSGIIWTGKRSDFNKAVDACPAAGCEGTQEKHSSQYDAPTKTPAIISDVGFIAGGVLVAGGAVLYFTAPKAPSSSAARIHLTPALGPTTAGAMLGGSF